MLWTEMQSECKTKGSMSSNAKNGIHCSSVITAEPLRLSLAENAEPVPFIECLELLSTVLNRHVSICLSREIGTPFPS